MSQLSLWPEYGHTSSAGDSPAKTSVAPAKGPDSTETEADSGLRCCVSSPSLDRIGYSLRTYLRSELEGRTSLSLVWKEQATPCGRSWWVLGRAALPSDGTGFGLWQGNAERETGNAKWGTPRVTTNGGMGYPERAEGGSRIEDQVAAWPTVWSHEVGDYQYSQGDKEKPVATLTGAVKDWATPQAENFRSRGGDRKDEMGLDRQVHWATPTCQDGSNNAGPSQFNRNGRPLNVEVVEAWPTPRTPTGGPESKVSKAKRGAGGIDLQTSVLTCGQPDVEPSSSSGKNRAQLNPRWVAQLMGWPMDFYRALEDSVSRCLAMGGFRKSRT